MLKSPRCRLREPAAVDTDKVDTVERRPWRRRGDPDSQEYHRGQDRIGVRATGHRQERVKPKRAWQYEGRADGEAFATDARWSVPNDATTS